MQMLSQKALLPLVVFLSVKAFPAKIIREGKNETYAAFAVLSLLCFIG